MAALGHLVFILAFVGITHSALIVPFWRHLPEAEVPRQQEMAVESEDDYQEEDPKQIFIGSGPLGFPLCSGYLGDWFYCLNSENQRTIIKKKNILKTLRLR